MGSGLKEDPKEEVRDENGSTAKVRDWDEDLNYGREWFLHGHYDEDWDDDHLRSWCLPGQFDGPDGPDDRIAKRIPGGSMIIFNYHCAKIANQIASFSDQLLIRRQLMMLMLSRLLSVLLILLWLNRVRLSKL